jgi:hypothetical protein
MAATTTTQVSNQGWTSLGSGPLTLQAAEGDIYVQDATSAPSGAGGFLLRKTDGRVDFDTTNTLYAMSAAPSQVYGGVQQTANDTVISAPVAA